MAGFLTIIGIWFLSLNDSVLRRDARRPELGNVAPIPVSEDQSDLVDVA